MKQPIGTDLGEMIPLNGFVRRVAMASGITLLSLVTVKVMTLINSIVLARLLQPTDFGMYSVVVNLQNVVWTIAAFGIPVALAKSISEFRNTDRVLSERIGSALLILLLVSSTVSAIGLLLLADIVANNLYHDEGLVWVIRLSAIPVILGTLNLGLSSVLQGCQSIRRLAEINAVAAAVTPPIAFLSVSEYGLVGAIVALTLSNAASSILLYVQVRRTISLSFSKGRSLLADRPRFRSLMHFTIPAFISNLLVIPAYWIAKSVLALDSGFGSVGEFQIAESLSQIIMVLPVAMSIPLLPMISEQSALNPEAVGRTSEGLLRIVMFLALPLSIIIMPFLQPAIGILYGGDYSAAYIPVLLMFASSTFIAVASVLSNVFMGIGRMWDMLLMNLIWLIVFLSTLFVFVPKGNATGLASTYAVSYVALLLFLLAHYGNRFKSLIWGMVGATVAYFLFVVSFVTYLADGDFVSKLVGCTATTIAFALAGYALVLGNEERRLFKTALARLGSR